MSRLDPKEGSDTDFETDDPQARLGDVASAVLEILREVEIPVSVQQVHQTLELRHGTISYSTVKNVLNRSSKDENSKVVRFKRGVYLWARDPNASRCA